MSWKISKFEFRNAKSYSGLLQCFSYMQRIKRRIFKAEKDCNWYARHFQINSGAKTRDKICPKKRKKIQIILNLPV
jgi:hypothetical protein